MTLGDKLRQLRQDKALTPEQLADRSGLSFPLVYAYERGSHVPGLGTLLKLAHALEVRLSEFEGCELPQDFRSPKGRTATAGARR